MCPKLFLTLIIMKVQEFSTDFPPFCIRQFKHISDIWNRFSMLLFNRNVRISIDAYWDTVCIHSQCLHATHFVLNAPLNSDNGSRIRIQQS